MIHPSGILDEVSGRALLGEVCQALSAGEERVVIACEGITFMDSNGFSALVRCLKKVREAGHRLSLQSPGPQMKMVLEMTGTDKIFEVV
ncbi:STAS domain-containing protein [Cyanobium gracile]|uniref:Anti-anti-sigma regulatory factor (Antagonist of anti-sigma factor) n=1 Tax=Cyanobium gracile (strain ATCC 27147 / PCC 6307) TaxID=292564 RepID=K9P3L2_CYAGP|nr:STAS domain-containing protein [Cyanobium gracile]AFY27568.1 anti-anti-sigma regulatory factor (antagonist of anti-sigma factor) [Cyanobium gracile PCC 6307]